MTHTWHADTIEACATHAASFAHSCLNVLRGDRINTSMQAALVDDMRDVLEDLERIKDLNIDVTDQPADRSSYIQHLEGVVFVQLHQIQQLRKEVARHAAPA